MSEPQYENLEREIEPISITVMNQDDRDVVSPEREMRERKMELHTQIKELQNQQQMHHASCSHMMQEFFQHMAVINACYENYMKAMNHELKQVSEIMFTTKTQTTGR